ncbi:helix-turn-helix domain-containing protein [Marispirochaeta sp.]|jgi:AcrR family transcriptional regulator|uniref:TetR/AcrR family transcriptional regulator n=1 Tax=Marispirochaeta sp. TaxID=2038653 RepID=UPI0029C685AB|nr:helix-turn-helix domain-containing protein [Marispirochaeta sp.]
MGMSNREKIYRTACSLFSAHGYRNVSLRDIASKIPIRASSIYNHFPEKAAILDEVVLRFRQELRALGMNDVPENLNEILIRNGPEAVLSDLMLAPVDLLQNEKFIDSIRIVTRGQYFHEGVREFLYDEFFFRPRKLVSSVLERIRMLGWRFDCSTDFLTAELLAPVAANFYERSLQKENRHFDSGRIRDALRHHVHFIWRAASMENAGEES